MKNLILILTLSLSAFAQCQTANIITLTEFNNIEINGNKLLDIKNTNGNLTEIINLFGNPINSTIDSDGEFYYYEYNGFSIGFSSLLSDSINQTQLSSFNITNNNYNITIQGVTVTVGDNISLLGNVIFNTMNNGNQSIVFMYCDGCNNFISIRFNQLTNIITEIIYLEQT